MKKVFNSLLALGLVLGAMCVDVDAAHKVTLLEVEKTVELEGGNVLPAEEFTFVMTPADVAEGTMLDHLEVKEGVALDDDTITITYDVSDSESTKNASFDLSSLAFDKEAAIYRYKITETAGSSNGLTYDTNSYLADIYVTNEGTIEYVITKDETATNKEEVTFNNIYETETLEVSKVVEGIFADKYQDFTFRLTVNEMSTLPAGTVLSAVKTLNDGTEETVSITVGEENVFTLKHNENLSLDNLPEGLTYTVTEDAAEGYTTTYVDSDNGVMSDDGASVAFTNTKIETVETGVMLDVAPYVLSLGSVAGLSLLFVSFKKNKEE